MGFSDDYLKLREKRKKEEEERLAKAKKNSATEDIAPIASFATKRSYEPTSEYKQDRLNALSGDVYDAPLPEGLTPISDEELDERERQEKMSGEGKWFKGGLFADGYQFGDALGTVGGTLFDVGATILQGGANLVEGVGDAGVYLVAGAADLLGADSAADALRADAKVPLVNNFFDDVKQGNGAEEASLLGEKSRGVGQALGQIGAIIATGGAAGYAGLGAAGTTAVTTGAVGLSSTGHGFTEGYNSKQYLEGKATDADIFNYALTKGFIDAGSEAIFGGLGKTINALGVSRGIGALDDIFARKVSSKITDVAARNIVEGAVKATGEGLEEVIAAHTTAVAKKLTYASDEDLNQLVKDEKALEQFVTAAIASGFAQGGDVYKATKSGTDFVTGLTNNEQAVIDKEVENRIAEQEKDGTKLTNKEKGKIEEAVKNDLKKGYISTDTIESVLGGETFNRYKSLEAQETALQDEISQLENKPKEQITVKEAERLTEAREELKNLDKIGLKTQLSEEVFNLAKNDSLVESYNEGARRGEAFTADLTAYDEKQRAVVQKAIDSGFLNNTNRTHEFVDMVAKISADKGVSFDFTNNERLKTSGFAVEGKTVNGYVTKDGITVNMDSPKYVNSVVGHEITHVLEGTELYTELQKAVFEYAKGKNDYQGRYDSIAKLYETVENADIDAELTADLVGDYLFTDSDFINNLSTNHRNVFQKIYDEIKYLCKIATAGSKEAQQLEKVKKAFAEAYRTESKAPTDTKYSVSDKNIKDVTTGYSHGETYFTMSYEQNGEVVGTLEYGEYDGQPNVKMIEVDPEHRRQGIGTKLLQELQKKYPETEIDFGMSTPDGTKLIEAATYTKTDEQAVEGKRKLQALQTELVDVERRLNELYDLEELTAEQEQEMERLGERWDELYYTEIRNAEKEYGGKPESKRFVKYSLDKYTEKQYNAFGWARDTEVLSKNELDDLYSKIHVKGSLKKFAQSSSGEAIVEVNDKPHTTLATNNAFVFVVGTKNAPEITRVVRVNAFDEESVDIFRKDIYANTDHRTLEAYARVMGEEFVRYYDRSSSSNYGEYTNKARAQQSGSESEGVAAVDRNNGQRSGAFEQAQSREIAPNKASSTDGVFFDGNNPKFSLTEYTAEEKQAHNKAVLEHFGRTYQWNETGYLLLDGSKLDLSGKHDGAPGGYRTVDHRDITEALGYDYGGDDYSGSLIQFMSEGNIRIIPESNGINLSVKPTKAQEQALSDYISRCRGEMLLDIDDLNGNTVVSVEYPKGTYYKKILSDIQEWFDNGKKPENTSRYPFFSLSAENEQQKTYGNYNIFGKDLMLEKAPTQESVEETAPVVEETAETATTETAPVEVAPVIDNTETAVQQTQEAPIKAENTVAPETPKTKRKPSKAALVRYTKTKNAGHFKLQGAYNLDGKQYISDGNFVAEFDTIDEKLAHNEEFPIDRLRQFLNGALENQSTEKYSIDLDKIIELNKATKDRQFITVGGTPYDSKYIEAVSRAIVNPTFALSDYRGGVKALVAVGDNGRAMLMPVRPGDNMTAVYEAQEITAAPEFAPTTAEDATAAREASTQSLNDVNAPQEIEAPIYEASTATKSEDPFTERDYKGVGKKNVKAFMSENPEVKPYFQEAAQAMLGDLQNSTRGERWYNDEVYYESGGESGYSGTKRHTTDDIAYLLDNGYTYAEIEKGINAIIEDHGKENIAVAKRIEFALNDRLRQGYTDVYGEQIPPNEEYLALLSKKQTAEAVASEAPALTDADAPMDDIAPVVEKYEAIRPQRPKQAAQEAQEPQPRMVRADKTDKGEMRRWAETSTESETIKDEINIEELDQELIHYQPISNKKTLEKANAQLNSQGYDNAITYFKGRVTDRKASVEDIVLGERLVQEATKRGDKAAAMDLIQDIAILGTELGQKVQALSIIQRLTPEGQLKMLHRVIERGKATGDKAFEGVEVTQGMVDKIASAYDANFEDAVKRIQGEINKLDGVTLDRANVLKASGDTFKHRNKLKDLGFKYSAKDKAWYFTEQENTYSKEKLDAAMEEVKQELAEQMKVTVGEKINAWRYLAMLGNPKTHIRNIVSNVAMKGTAAVKNALARTIEDIAPIKDRTKTWKKASAEVTEYAKQVRNEMGGVLSGESKYSETASIKGSRKIFKNKVLDFLAELNNKALSAEDNIFKNSAFESTFREYLTANGIRTEADIQNNPEIVEKGKQHAVEQALIATFQQDSWLADQISKAEKKNAAFGVGIGSVLPFKKTPINIAKTALNYSPLGAIKTAAEVKALKNGEMSAGVWIDHLAQNITGTALTVLGYLLAKSGVLTGAGDDDKEGKYDYQLGEQGYALKIGDQTYSLSWLTPVSMPLFVGANAYEQLVEDKGWSGDVVMETLAQTLDPLSEMSFLSGLDSALSSYDSGIEKFMGIGKSAIQNYATQFVPTALSQVAAITDDTKRSTKVAADSDFKMLDETVNKIKYKIPGLRNTLEPSTDIWGNEIKQSDNVLTRAFESAIAPYARKEDISTEIDAEIKELYGETGDDGLIPSIPDNYVNYNGEKYNMSAEEYTDFKKTYGQTAYEMLEELFETTTYQNSTSEERAELVNRVYDYARDQAKLNYLAQEGVDYTNATVEGEEVYKDNAIKGAIENDMTLNEFDMFANNPKKYEFLQTNGISYEEYSASEESKELYDWAYRSPKRMTYAKAVGGLETYRTYYDSISEIKEKVGEGEKEAVKDYIFSLNIDYGERIILYRSMYESKEDRANYNADILDYLNSRDDISYEDTVAILEELGFTVDENGYARWD